MNQPFTPENWTDAEDNPAGGVAYGTGFCISWQNGPLGRGDDRQVPNGAFVETILEVVQSRLEFYQSTRFACDANENAIHYIENALEHLRARTADREARDVEGTHAE